MTKSSLTHTHKSQSAICNTWSNELIEKLFGFHDIRDFTKQNE